MIIHDFDENKFNEIISKGVVLIDFFATWCGPCKMLAPELESFSKKNTDVTICKVDVDIYGNLAKEYGIMSVPTLVLYKDGELVKKTSGYMTDEIIEEWINS